MSNAIEIAEQAARRAIESRYTGLCTVKAYQEITDPVTHITRTRLVTIFEDQPCRLSYETLTAAVQTDTAATIAQGVKLFISPDVVIPAGSTITVTQAGRTTIYNKSGQAAVYPTHQEIILSLEDEYA